MISDDLHKFTNSINRVLSVQNRGSSGSKLVHALVDNHPNVLAIPSLYMMYFFLQFWPENIDRNKKSVLEEFFLSHKYWFDPKGYAPWGTDRMGLNGDESAYVEKRIFTKNLHIVLGNNEKVNRKLFFQSLYVAYSLSIGRKLDLNPEEYIMIFPHHSNSVQTAIELTKDFPETFFLHLFREPIQSLGSSCKLYLKRGVTIERYRRYTIATYGFYILLRDKFRVSKEQYKIYSYSPILHEYGPSSRGVRLEDLVDAPKKTLLKVCEWVGIPWSDELLKATYNGKTWWNRPESARVTGLSKIPLSRTHADLFTKYDKYRLNILFSEINKQMGYKSIKWKATLINKIILLLSLLFPFKLEMLCIFPSKFSLQFNFNEIVNEIINKRTLRVSKLRYARIAINKTKKLFIVWILLIPIQGYIECRIALFSAYNKLINGDYDVVKIL
tara:strand:+ start:2470 stop:3795 length:1326 start_codon:yes stop_codon:yes gene_type:complete